jgi:hypothetical protein
MITLVQSKIVTGGTVTFDSPVTAGNTIIAVLTYTDTLERANYPVDSQGGLDTYTYNNLGTIFNSGKGLTVFVGFALSNGPLSLSWTLFGFSVANFTTILEFTTTLDSSFDVQTGTTLTPVLFPDAVAGDLCICATSSDSDTCVFTFPEGTIINSLNGTGEGALGSAYTIATTGAGTLYGVFSSGNTLYVAGRLESSLPPGFNITCGTLHQRPIPE